MEIQKESRVAATGPRVRQLALLDFIRSMLTHPLKTAIDYYATCLAACAMAVAYLARNCLTSAAALQVGFADRTLGTHLPSNTFRVGKEIRSKLESVGIYQLIVRC